MTMMKHEWAKVEEAAKRHHLNMDRVEGRDWERCLAHDDPVVNIENGWARIVPLYSRRRPDVRSAKQMEVHVRDLLAGKPAEPEKEHVVGPDVGKVVAGMALRVILMWYLLRLQRITFILRDDILVHMMEMSVYFQVPWSDEVLVRSVSTPLVVLEHEYDPDFHLDAFMGGCVDGLLHRIRREEP